MVISQRKLEAVLIAVLLAAPASLFAQPEELPEAEGTAEAEELPEAEAEAEAEPESPEAEVVAEEAGETPPPVQPETGGVEEVAPVEVSASTTREPAKIGLVVAPKVGGILPTNKLAATYFVALELGYMPPAVETALGLPVGFGIECSYAEPGHSGAVASQQTGSVDFTLDQRLITIGIEAFVQLPMGDLTPYGGIGYGIYLLQATATALDQENVESQVRSGMQLRAGAGYRLGPGDLFGELRYHYANLEFATTGEVNTGGVTFDAGYRMIF